MKCRKLNVIFEYPSRAPPAAFWLPAAAYALTHSWQTALALTARQLNKNIHAEV